ncbi:MAG: DUF2332 family protein [Pseudomonadota bacterium]
MSGIREHFSNQARACRALGSPFTADLLEAAAERLDEHSAVGRTVLNWPGDPRADALGLRFAGSLHRLVLMGVAPELARTYPTGQRTIGTGALWSQVAEALAAHETALLGSLQSPPQTNEVARCAVLVGGFAAAAERTGRPLALLEIGASAGLNLHWDAYRYVLGGTRWGPEGASVQLEPEWRGASPTIGPVEVRHRLGCDQAPIDPSNHGDRLRLRSYIWPDQTARLARLDAALDHAARQQLRVEQADAADWVLACLARRPDGHASVLYHSIVWQYLLAATQRRIEDGLAEAGAAASADAPLAWLRMEPSSVVGKTELLLTTWPGGITERLAYADYHGRWVEWLGGE